MAKEVNESMHNTSYFKLTSDIMLGAYPWVPIGDRNSPESLDVFAGNFDGQGHTIYGLNIDTDQSGQGLFCVVEFGLIKNLNLKSGIIKTTDDFVGSLAAELRSKVENVTSDVEVYGGSIVGGLVGYGYDSCNISMCTYNGYVSGDKYVGGIIGTNEGTVEKCFANCYISSGNNAGAIAGWHFGIISNCIARGAIDGTGNILAGECYGAVTACYFYGTAALDNLTLDSGMTACYAVVNDRIVTTNDFDNCDWTQYWAIVPEINNGLPVQKELFWIGNFASTTLDDLKNLLTS